MAELSSQAEYFQFSIPVKQTFMNVKWAKQWNMLNRYHSSILRKKTTFGKKYTFKFKIGIMMMQIIVNPMMSEQLYMN